MKEILRKHLQDSSTQDIFNFSLCCEACGRLWKSTPIPFSKAGVSAATKEKQIIYDALYKKEKDNAYTRALDEAKKVFSLCPICGHLVCDHCFLLCEELDMCCECAERLKESGSPVKSKEA